MTSEQEIAGTMVSYKQPGFAERAELARNAKQKALDQLRAKPPVDPAVLAERQAIAEARNAAAAEARRALTEARVQAKIEKRKAAEERAAAAAAQPERDEARQKAARDARYAARKQRAS
jgi:hypothetical protein